MKHSFANFRYILLVSGIIAFKRQKSRKLRSQKVVCNTENRTIECNTKGLLSLDARLPRTRENRGCPDPLPQVVFICKVVFKARCLEMDVDSLLSYWIIDIYYKTKHVGYRKKNSDNY